MKKIAVILLVVGLGAVGIEGRTHAQTQEKGGRPCLASDLIGTWQLKGINSKSINNSKDTFFWPYQRITFTNRGGMKEMVAQEPFEKTPGLLKKFDNTATTTQYQLDARGVMLIKKFEAPMPEKCLCVYTQKDVPREMLDKIPAKKILSLPAKGDIVLTYVDPSGKPVAAKTFKKVS